MNARTTASFAAAAALVLLLSACGGNEAAPAASPSPSATTEPSPAASPSPSPSPAASPSATAAPSPSAPAPAPEESAPPETSSAPDEGMPPTAEEAATTVIRALKAGNMKTLAAWTHMEKGVRFSPYGYVDTAKDLVLDRDTIEGAMKDPTKRVWGAFAGSGEEIKLSFAEYMKKFVYDADFMGLGKVTVNEKIDRGSTLNNITEVYPPDQYDVVEYYIDGVDPQYRGMDWRSLKLVFEKLDADRILVGIVHDQWTP